MLWQKLLGSLSKQALPLEFVGGKSATAAASQFPSYSLTGLTGGAATQPDSGDIVIACVQFTNRTDRNIACTTSGYVEVADLYADGEAGACQVGVYYKVLTSAETSVAFNLGTSSASRFVCHVWRNPNVTPFDATAVTATGIDVANAPAITTISSDAVVIAVGAVADSPDSGITALTVPSGMGNFFVASSLGGSENTSGSLGIASILRATAGAYDPPAFGGGGVELENGSCAITMALRPQ